MSEELIKTLKELKQELKRNNATLIQSSASINLLQQTNLLLRSNLLQELHSAPTENRAQLLAALLAAADANEKERITVLNNVQHTSHLLKAKFEKKTNIRFALPPFPSSIRRAPQLPSRRHTPDPNLALRQSLSEKSTAQLSERWSGQKLHSEVLTALHPNQNQDHDPEQDTSNTNEISDHTINTLCDMLIERATTSTQSLPFSKLPNNKTDSDSTATNEKEEISFTLATGETLAHDHEWIHQLRVGYKPPIHTSAAANTALYCTHYVYDTIIPTISTEDTNSPASLILEPEEDNIRSATLCSLIQRLTHPSLPELKVQFVFLLTYRKYTSPHGLLTLLIHRFFVPNGVAIESSTIRSQFQNMIVAPIQMKVLEVIQLWLTDFYDDFKMKDTLLDDVGNEAKHHAKSRKSHYLNSETIQLKTHNHVLPPLSMYHALEQFLIYIRVYFKQVTGEWTKQTAEDLLKTLKTKRKKEIHALNQLNQLNHSTHLNCLNSADSADNYSAAETKQKLYDHMPPESIVPLGGLHASMFVQQPHHFEPINTACLLSPIEVARQCTLIDHALLCKIRMKECLSKKRTKRHVAPNIWNMIKR